MRTTRSVPLSRLAAIIALAAALFTAHFWLVGLPAAAQDSTAQPQPAQAAPAPAAEAGAGQDPAAHRARLDSARAQLDQIESALARQDLSEGDLQRLRELLATPAAQIEAALTALAPKVDAERQRLVQLGPEPAAGATPETPEVSSERTERTRALKELEDTIRLASALKVQSEQIRATLLERRQAAFTRMIFQRSQGLLSPGLWSRLVAALPGEFAALSTVAGDWLATFERRARSGQALVLLAAIGIGLALHFARVRLLPHVARRPAEVTDPSRLRRSVTALGIVLARSGPVLAGALVLYFALESIQLLPPRVAPVIAAFLTSLVFLAFVRALAHGLLAPGLPAWRLVPVQEGTAQKLITAVTTGSALVLLFTTAVRAAESIGADYSVLVLLRGLYATTIAGLLALTLHRTQGGGAEDEACLGPYVPDSTAGGPLRAVGWLVTAVIVIACLAGYIALANFLVEQVLWVSTLAALLYLLLALVEETFEHAVRPESRFALTLQTSLGLRRRAVEQFSVLLGGALRILLAVGALVLVLAPWGIESSDILASLRHGLAGIQFGEVRLSPTAIAISIVTFLIVILVTRAVQRWLDKTFLPTTDLDAGLRNSIRTATGYLGFFAAVALATAQMGLSLEKIAIVAGALSVGIGFGLQSIVNNFVSGLILLWERPIRVGDWVVVGDEQGYVRRINVRATEIETFDRAMVIVPNSNLISGVVKNWVHNNRVGRIIVPVGVSYDADPEEAARILESCAREHSEILSDPAPTVLFTRFGDSSLDFELRCFVGNVETAGSVKSALLFTIFRRLREAGIAIPYPQRDLHLHGSERLEQALERLSDTAPPASTGETPPPKG